MTEYIATSRTVDTWFCGVPVVALGSFMVLITLLASYDILFGYGFGWMASAILAVIVFWGVVLLWGPIILLSFIVMLSLIANMRGLSTFRFRIPG